MWAEKDSNLRTRERTDLQSVAFSHSAIYPFLNYNPHHIPPDKGAKYMVKVIITRATCRNRTSDLLITNQLLYLLSYSGNMSRRRGSNPPPTAWKAVALPNELLLLILNGRDGWIRTNNISPQKRMSYH